MQLTIQIISYCRLNARADRIFRGALYKLIDAGEIPFEQVGSHRRLRLCDVEGLRERRRAESRKALDAIAALEDDNCDYFDNYGETTRE